MNTEGKRPPRPEPVDLRETGAPIDGEPQVSDKRLFFQLHVFECRVIPEVIVKNIQSSRSSQTAVFYDDLNNPTGLGVLFIDESPTHLMLQSHALQTMQRKGEILYRPEMTMIGRTYSSGREPDLEEWLINKPLRNVLNPEFPWAIWYPLRRNPEFYRSSGA